MDTHDAGQFLLLVADDVTGVAIKDMLERGGEFRVQSQSLIDQQVLTLITQAHDQVQVLVLDVRCGYDPEIVRENFGGSWRARVEGFLESIFGDPPFLGGRWLARWMRAWEDDQHVQRVPILFVSADTAYALAAREDALQPCEAIGLSDRIETLMSVIQDLLDQVSDVRT